MAIHLPYLLCYLLFAVTIAQGQTQDSVIRIPGSSYINNVRFSQDGSFFMSSDRDTVRVRDVSSGKQIGASIVLSSISGYATFLPGDSTILTMAFASDTVFNVWDWRSGTLLRSVNLYRPVNEAVMTADGRELAILVYFPKRQYEIWNIASGTYQRVLTDKPQYRNLQLGTIGDYGVLRGDTSFYRINMKNGVVEGFNSQMPDFFDAYLSQDGKRIGYARIINQPAVFDVGTLDSLFDLDIEIDDYTSVIMDVSPDNKLIATVTTRRFGMGILDLWDGSNGNHLMTVANDSSLRYGTLKMSPRNNCVIVYRIDSGMFLWPISLPNSSVPAAPGFYQETLVYPNPVRAGMNVEWYQANSGAVMLEVFTLDGKQVYEKGLSYREPGTYREYVETDSMVNGSYFCRIEVGGHSYAIRFIVER